MTALPVRWCTQHDCDLEARWLVHWPNAWGMARRVGPNASGFATAPVGPMCDQHKRQAEHIATQMGFRLSSTAIGD